MPRETALELANKSLDNAEGLVAEAQLPTDAGRHARSFPGVCDE